MRLACAVLGLLVLAAGCSGGSAPIAPSDTAAPAGVAWDRAQPIDVVLNEYSFTPSHLVLQADQPYALHLRNAGSTRHTFTAPEFFANVAFGPGAAAGQIPPDGGTVSVAAGQSAEVDVLPLHTGTYPLTCERPLHSLFGMTGEIVVQ